MIVINLNKAKAIAHDIRRDARSKEFEPYDAIIAQQIPGTSAQQAEAARAEIREKYAQMQTAVDAATSPQDLKAVLGI